MFMKLQSTWSQPGRDKKVFCGDMFTITWKRSKKILNFDGEESNKVKRLFCIEICDMEDPIQIVDQKDKPTKRVFTLALVSVVVCLWTWLESN